MSLLAGLAILAALLVVLAYDVVRDIRHLRRYRELHEHEDMIAAAACSADYRGGDGWSDQLAEIRNLPQ